MVLFASSNLKHDVKIKLHTASELVPGTGALVMFPAPAFGRREVLLLGSSNDS